MAKMPGSGQRAETNVPTTTPPDTTTPCPGATIGLLDHYTVNGGMRDIDTLRDFYRSILGMAEGPRPDFDFPGYWMYAGGKPVVHIVGFRDRETMAAEPTGAMDHISLRCTGFAAMRAHLAGRGIAHRINAVPGGRLAQIFITDPMGVSIELLYSGADVPQS